MPYRRRTAVKTAVPSTGRRKDGRMGRTIMIRHRTRMKPKERMNEDEETEWEDFSDSEQSSEDDDPDTKLSNKLVTENLPAKLNPTMGKNKSRTIIELRQQIPDIPLIYLPTSEPEARVLQAMLAVHSAASSPSLARSSALPTLVAAQKIDELLAGDSVTYDDTEGTENEPEDVDDDNDSVATDASGDADELNVGNFISHNRAGSSTTAVDNQAIARVSYELARHAPKIQELAHCLAKVNSVHSENQRLQISSYQEPLSKLLAEIQ
ncbi:hypothetical protein DFH08DRAFT_815857 [Mycena albidolilacea]|uniref:Uncharacterized protein n=1 Tax=Mycena albidolilacea TaxID=1033008 RepID=A0AAD7EIN3_9AGAR|nr:hypothetical protein DFH08DRAFT_815857 [Mycena albidolilacea]